MRIAVRKFLFAQQRAAIAQQREHDRIRLKNSFSFIFRQAFEVPAVPVNGRICFDPIFLAGLEIFDAVSGSGMHNSGSLFERDVIRENGRHNKIQERVPEF
jgi:hypothetical protein